MYDFRLRYLTYANTIILCEVDSCANNEIVAMQYVRCFAVYSLHMRRKNFIYSRSKF